MNRLWMPFWVNDYVGGTRKFSTLEHGAYILLILEYWQHGGLPTDDKRLARIAGLSLKRWLSIKEIISQKFSLPEWRHARIDAELAKAKRKQKHGVDMAARRWEARNKPDATGNAYSIATGHAKSIVTTTTTIEEGNGVLRTPFSARASARVPTSEKKSGTRLPQDWQPSEADLAFAATQLPPDRIPTERDTFRDYWLARSGPGAVKRDWPATWRNWCRKAATQSPTRNGGTGGQAGQQNRFRAALDKLGEHVEGRGDGNGQEMRPSNVRLLSGR
jgi:uncharacterized protein YdaU (DUF1376 family)